MSTTSHSGVPATDTSGRDRFGRNVVFAWGGYMVNVVSGFIVPRMIDDRLGQVTLGVWDFAWTFVSYFGLVQLGIGGAISRYVAAHRANEDVVGLNKAVSTVAVFQKTVGWLAMALAAVAAWWVLPFFAARLGGEMETARQVILIQGAEIALYISLSVYGSVITGCHRWDLHNTVSASAYALAATGMISVLMLGGGLTDLAIVHCVVMTGGELVRRKLVKRVCPELRIDRRLASWPLLTEQMRYGMKSLVPSVSNLLSNQFLNILVVVFLGPASLAVLSRSRGMMNAMRTLAAKFGMIVVPTSSALHARGDQASLRETLLKTPALISSLAMPVMIVMALLGDRVMGLWMGADYVQRGLIAVLCVGTFSTLVQEPVWSLLCGMNLHGRVAKAKLAAATISAVFLTIGLWMFQWQLLGAAVCFILPQVIVDGIITPWQACTVLGVSKIAYCWHVCARPALHALPLTAGLLIVSRIAGIQWVWSVAILGAGCACCGRLVLDCWFQFGKEITRHSFMGLVPKRCMGLKS